MFNITSVFDLVLGNQANESFQLRCDLLQEIISFLDISWDTVSEDNHNKAAYKLMLLIVNNMVLEAQESKPRGVELIYNIHTLKFVYNVTNNF